MALAKPDTTLTNLIDIIAVDLIFRRDLRARPSIFSDAFDFVCRQFIVAVFLPKIKSPISNRVSRIIFLTAKAKVAWINAFPVPAFMSNNPAFRNRPILVFKNKSWGGHYVAAAYRNLSISMTAGRALPFPALIWETLVDPSPKPLNGWYS